MPKACLLSTPNTVPSAAIVDDDDDDDDDAEKVKDPSFGHSLCPRH